MLTAFKFFVIWTFFSSGQKTKMEEVHQLELEAQIEMEMLEKEAVELEAVELEVQQQENLRMAVPKAKKAD